MKWFVDSTRLRGEGRSHIENETMWGASSNFFKFFIISFILKMYFYVIFKTLKIYILVGKPVRKNEFSESCFSGS